MITRSILDQNQLYLLNIKNPYEEIIISPVFMWEFFNNINTNIESLLIRKIQEISNQIFITFKSITCEKLEIAVGHTLLFDEIVDHQNTNTIRQWLKSKTPSISQVRDIFSPNFTNTSLDRLKTHAETSWVPLLKEGFNKLLPKDRPLIRDNFKDISEETTRKLCYESIQVCFKILKDKKYSEEQANKFLKEPTILYNRAFCHFCLYLYRSTQTSFKDIANDNKDIELLFCAHHVDKLISNERFMKYTFSHLKESHKLLINLEEILKSVDVQFKSS